jgi:predicted DNA-binding transcriptional regulator AlpA/predicted nucleic acid-binding Zn ribbon protein
MEGRTERIVKLRREGMSLRQIGNKVGLSAERVRQLLKEKVPPGHQGLLSTPQLVELTGVSDKVIYRLMRQQIISPRRQGRNYLWSSSTLKTIRERTHSFCVVCGTPITLPKKKFCGQVCRNKSQWKRWDEEQRRKQVECVKAWEERNPERARIIERRAARKYRQKMREEKCRKQDTV